MDKFSKREAVRYGWNTVIANFRFFLPITLIILGWSLGVEYATRNLQEANPLAGGLINIAVFVVSLGFNLGFIKIALKFLDGQKAELGDLFSMFGKLVNYFLATVLYMLVVTVGFILLIVPGIIWVYKYSQYSYLIVDEDLGPLAALKRSAALTKGQIWNLLLLSALLGAINMLGVLALFLGLFVTIPLTVLASTFVYRKLQQSSMPAPIPSTRPAAVSTP